MNMHDLSGADPGFRRGGFVHSEGGGGGFVPEFQERIHIVAGPWANQQATKKIADSRRGGGFLSPKKNPWIRAWPLSIILNHEQMLCEVHEYV